ncbi:MULTISPECIES: hypothetical protein [Spirulina sp. CCY15215]|uniref:hypothetical protein n=1 Tax=Spirulina sp. CCY15215 TaxID=2767591 RepID=UPI0019506AEA|nr:hypothetical protein [Spirulina major]
MTLLIREPATPEQLVQMIDRSFYDKIKDLNWQDKLGNLASTLAKISTQATISQQDRLTVKLLREAALIIEWSISEVPQMYHLELAAMQKECLAWCRVHPVEEVRSILALYTQNQSDRLLEISGLLTNIPLPRS